MGGEDGDCIRGYRFGEKRVSAARCRRSRPAGDELPELAKLLPRLIGIEACTGAFFCQRQFEKLGHTVWIIAPQYVKPFVKHQKNDRNDAEAICTAMCQPNMKFVPPKNEEKQDI